MRNFVFMLLILVVFFCCFMSDQLVLTLSSTEHLEEGALNGRPYYKQENTEGKVGYFVYFTGERWLVSKELGKPPGRRVKWQADNIGQEKLSSWLDEVFCQVEENDVMRLHIVIYALIVTFFTPSLRHFWCLPVV